MESSSGTQMFGWVDYLVFALTLVISATIGIYYAFSGKRQRSAKEVFVGDRKMTLLPVTLSVMASFMSAVAVLGTPAEVYTNGIMYMYLGLSYLIAFPCAAHVFVPMFYRLDCVSAHEYLRLRFNETVRIAASGTFVIQMLVYMAVVLYAPAMAFSQVSGLSMWLSIFTVGCVCTAYTALGGIKGVMWTDCFQVLLMFGGLLTVIVRGTIAVGGVGAVLSAAERGGRLNWYYIRPLAMVNVSAEETVSVYDTVWNPSPLERHTLWTLLIGGAFMCGTIYSGNQAQIQRYLSCKSLRTAQLALWINIPVTWVMLGMFGMCGLVAYAVYEQCDPLGSERIKKKDQIIPYFVMDKMNVPGIPGVFLACVLSAALSTVSSCLNSLATVVMVDIVLPVSRLIRSRRGTVGGTGTVRGMGTVGGTGSWLTDRRVALMSKVLAVLLGLTTIGLAFGTQHVGGMVLPIALSIFGILGGPLLGLFVTGFFLPFVNSHGALAGLIASLTASFWISIGAILTQPVKTQVLMNCSINSTTETLYTLLSNQSMPSTLSTSEASSNSSSNSRSISSLSSSLSSSISESVSTVATTLYYESNSGQWRRVYEISYLYYGAVAVIVCVVVASLVSVLTKCNKGRNIDRRLYYPIFTRLHSCCSGQEQSACCTETVKISFATPTSSFHASVDDLSKSTENRCQLNHKCDSRLLRCEDGDVSQSKVVICADSRL